LKPTRANNSQDPISKKNHTNRADEVAQVEGPEFKTQYLKKKKMSTILQNSITKNLTFIAVPKKIHWRSMQFGFLYKQVKFRFTGVMFFIKIDPRSTIPFRKLYLAKHCLA
jgi:hypothetical protein